MVSGDGDRSPESEGGVAAEEREGPLAEGQRRPLAMRHGSEAAGAAPPRHRRFLSERMGSAAEYLRAAESYVARKEGGEYDYLYRKPFDPSPGNRNFYDEWYSVMNLLGVMGLAPRDRVLEVGSGPGWVTEILVLLGFTVDVLEPAEDMNAISRERIGASVAQHHVRDFEAVRYHTATIEACEIAPESFEAVLFHASLHHIIDEERGLARSYELLRPGGVIGVSEGAWSPENVALEAQLEEEMRVSGTLESPFTHEYLDFLLARAGFVDVQRYHGINGFFPLDAGQRPLAGLATAPSFATNNLTARKPGVRFQVGRPIVATTPCRVSEAILVQGSRRLVLTALIGNTTDLIWYKEPRGAGYVTVALVGRRGAGERVEAAHRDPLPGVWPPGTGAMLTLDYQLPPDYAQYEWALELVSEHRYWFADHGTPPCPVPLPAPVDYAASLEVEKADWQPDAVEISFAVTNRGSEWPRLAGGLGEVRAVLVSPAADGSQREARARYALPELPAPGATAAFRTRFDLPADGRAAEWYLDLAAEGVTSFSSVGLSRARVPPASE